MLVRLELNEIVSRGTRPLEASTAWPVGFIADDAAVAYLAGSVSAASVFAPGPTGRPAETDILRWTRRVSAGTHPREDVLIGFGLLRSGDGEDSEPAWDAYRELVSLLQAFVQQEVARAAHVAPLLEAYGSLSTKAQPDDKELLVRLRKGIRPKELEEIVDPGLRSGIAAMRGVGQVLDGVFPGPSAPTTTDLAAHRAAVTAGLASPRVRPAPGHGPEPVGPGTVRPPRTGPKTRRPPTHGLPVPAADTVVAATVVAWCLSDIPPDRPLAFEQALPALMPVRSSLIVYGSIEREPRTEQA